MQNQALYSVEPAVRFSLAQASDSPGSPPGCLDVAEVAGRLRRIRIAKKRTLRTMAAALETTPQTIQRLETGAMTLSVDWLLKFCADLEIDPATLLQREQETALRVIATLGESQTLNYVPDKKQEGFALPTPAQGVFAVRIKASIGAFEADDILLACPAPSMPPCNRDWGTCLVSITNGPPALRQVLQTAGGQWVTVALGRGGGAQFTESVAWLARIITVVRNLPAVREAPEAAHADSIEANG